MTTTLPLIKFAEHGGPDRQGVLDGDVVRRFDAAIPTPANYIALDEAGRAAARERLNAPIARASVTLRAPLRPQKNVFCIGRNYVAHVDESIRARGDVVTLPTVPVFFTKAPWRDPNSSLPKRRDPTSKPRARRARTTTTP